MVYNGLTFLPGTSRRGPNHASIREPVVIRAIAKSLAKSRAAWAAVAAVAAAEAAVVVGSYGLERATLKRDENKASVSARVPGPFTRKIEMPGLSWPPAVAAGASGLADDEEVIGVVVAGRPRAYRLKALEYPPWHVVNDVIGDRPVTVAHCDLTGCTRAYAGPAGSGPLDVAQAGLVEGEMVVKVGGSVYVHRTGLPVDTASGAAALPYPEHEWTRTTWGAWSGRHPTTDVFVGVPGRRPD